MLTESQGLPGRLLRKAISSADISEEALIVRKEATLKMREEIEKIQSKRKNAPVNM
ncbi:hypothetical protein KEJ23_04555 [Candidatus Bathyarchaeota archaeon]|nr:hypothetical protein [Candidatus Bathyarchaeota archaeon]